MDKTVNLRYLSVATVISVLLACQHVPLVATNCANGTLNLGIAHMFLTYYPDNHERFHWNHIVSSVYGLVIDQENAENAKLLEWCIQLYPEIHPIGGYNAKGEIQALHDASPVIDKIVYTCGREDFLTETRNNSVIAMTGNMPSSAALYLDAMVGRDCVPILPSISTSPSLINYTIRMVTDDRYIANVMVQLLLQMNWTTVTAVVEDQIYGTDFFALFHRQIPEDKICIDQVFRVQEADKDRLDQPDFSDIYAKLEHNTDAKVILPMLNGPDADKFFVGAEGRGWLGKYQFVVPADALRYYAGRSIATGVDYSFLEGAITIEPSAQINPWVRQLTNKTLTELSYLAIKGVYSKNFYQSVASLIGIKHQCDIYPFFPRCMAIFPNCRATFAQFRKTCSGTESTEVDDWILRHSTFTLDTIYRIVNGLTGIYNASTEYHHQQQDLPQELSRVLFRCSTGTAETDDPSFCGPLMMTVYQFRRGEDGFMHLLPVGSASGPDVKLHLNTSLLFDPTYGATTEPACKESVLHARSLHGKGKCCRVYSKCASEIAILSHNNTCVDCPVGWLPSPVNETCVYTGVRSEILTPLQTRTLLWTPWFGLLLCAAMVTVFVAKRNTPLIRMSKPAFSTVLLATTIADFIVATAAADLNMTFGYCLTLWIVIGMSFAITACAVLAKLHFYLLAVRGSPFLLSDRMPTGFVLAFIYGTASIAQIGAFLILEWKGKSLDIITDSRSEANAKPYWVGYCTWFTGESFILLVHPILVNIISIIAALGISNIAINFMHQEVILSLIHSFLSSALLAVLGPYLTFTPALSGDLKYAERPEAKALFGILLVILSGYIKILCLFMPTFYLIVFKPEKNTVAWAAARRRLRLTSSASGGLSIRMDDAE